MDYSYSYSTTFTALGGHAFVFDCFPGSCSRGLDGGFVHWALSLYGSTSYMDIAYIGETSL